MLKKIKIQEFKELYRKHIVQDFPKTERPNLKGFRRRILKYNEKVFIFEEEKIKKGYCLVSEVGEYILVTFLAVYKENRGQGIGTKILNELKEKYNNKKGILLEVENPDFAENEKEKEIQTKRIKFYEKSEFEIVPNLNIKIFFVNFRIMIYHQEEQEIERDEIVDRLKEYYRRNVGKKGLKFIEFHKKERKI